MKREATMSLFVAALSLAVFLPEGVLALNTTNSQSASSAKSTSGQMEAMRMVPAEAVLVKGIDARKAQPGQQFKATLSDKVQLKNGPELPRGTELVGSVAKDDLHVNGTSRLALRFTQADLKSGKVIPIKATIVSVFGPDDPYNLDPNIWTSKMLQIDQEGVMSNVDMHSKIADSDSGVFVSTKKDALKLPRGYGIVLAIAPRTDSKQNGNGSNGGGA